MIMIVHIHIPQLDETDTVNNVGNTNNTDSDNDNNDTERDMIDHIQPGQTMRCHAKRLSVTGTSLRLLLLTVINRDLVADDGAVLLILEML